MNKSRNKLITTIVVLTVSVILIISLFVFFWPRSETSFFEIGLLGQDKLAKDYFPNNNSSITLGSQIDWYIYIHNHMGNNQNIIIKIKLANFTQYLPGSSESKYTDQNHFLEIPLSLISEETKNIPIYWTILEANNDDGLTTLNTINVNDEIISLENVNSNNSIFRMIFELWVYNKETKMYEFGWKDGQDISYASVDMTFRIS